MGLESVTYINDLVKTNPVASDKRHEGDDHMRGIKTALLAALNGVLGAREGLAVAATIATGNVTPAADTGCIFALAGEAGLADTLDTITHTNLYDGALVMVGNSQSSYAITLNHGVGSGDELIHHDAADIVLTDTDQFVLYFVDKTNSKNYEVLRSRNLPNDDETNTISVGELIRLVEQAAAGATPAASSLSIFNNPVSLAVGTPTGYGGLNQVDEGGFFRVGLEGAVVTLGNEASTLTNISGQIYYITPTAARTLTLPTTGVGKGFRLEIFNAAVGDAVDLLVTVNSSDGSATRYIPPGQSAWFRANQNTPTGPNHWDYQKGVIYVDEDNTSGTTTAIKSFTLPPYSLRATGNRLRITAGLS